MTNPINTRGGVPINKQDKRLDCLYCEPEEKKPSNHFICEVCSVGMCDECYDLDLEHTGHYNEICENADQKEYDAIIKKIGHKPAYLCEDCLGDIMKPKK